MALILLNGPPRAGKTTLARLLMDESVNSQPTQEITLNKPFTHFVQDALGLNDAEMLAGKDSPSEAEVLGLRAPIRDALIAAADAVELVDPDVWIKYALRNHPAFPYFTDALYVVDAIGKQTQLNWITEQTKAAVFILYVDRDEKSSGLGWFHDGRQRVNFKIRSGVGQKQGSAQILNCKDMAGYAETARFTAEVIRSARIEWGEI